MQGRKSWLDCVVVKASFSHLQHFDMYLSFVTITGDPLFVILSWHVIVQRSVGVLPPTSFVTKVVLILHKWWKKGSKIRNNWEVTIRTINGLPRLSCSPYLPISSEGFSYCCVWMLFSLVVLTTLGILIAFIPCCLAAGGESGSDDEPTYFTYLITKWVILYLQTGYAIK